MKTTKDLRKILFKEMMDLRCNRVTPRHAKQTTKIASQIIYSLRVDIENKRENIKIMKALSKNKFKDRDVKPLEIF